jgi:ATP-dependent Lhr-like helicase
LKALATDIARHLIRPVEEMRLSVSIETRTGDTPENRRARQRFLATERAANHAGKLDVLLSLPGAPAMFARGSPVS